MLPEFDPGGIAWDRYDYHQNWDMRCLWHRTKHFAYWL